MSRRWSTWAHSILWVTSIFLLTLVAFLLPDTSNGMSIGDGFEAFQAPIMQGSVGFQFPQLSFHGEGLDYSDYSKEILEKVHQGHERMEKDMVSTQEETPRATGSPRKEEGGEIIFGPKATEDHTTHPTPTSKGNDNDHSDDDDDHSGDDD